MDTQNVPIQTPEDFFEKIDALMGQIAGSLSKTLTEGGAGDGQKSTASLHFPLSISQSLWTQMVWENIAVNMAAGDADVKEFISSAIEEQHPGMLIDLYDMKGVSLEALNQTLWPVPSDGCFIDYYSGFDTRPGFEKLVRAVETGGLHMSPYTLINESGDVEFGVFINTPDEKPLKLYLDFMQDGWASDLSARPS